MARTGRPREFDRELAVDRAMHLFWEKGFESTSLTDLRKSLGDLSAASFYAAFGSKQALYIECLERYMGSCGEVTSVLDDVSLTPKAAVQAMLYRVIDVQTSPESPSGCMAVLSGLNCLDENKEVEKLTFELRKFTREAVGRAISKAVETGELSQDVDAETLNMLLDCFIKGIAIQARDGVPADVLHRAADKLLELWH